MWQTHNNKTKFTNEKKKINGFIAAVCHTYEWNWKLNIANDHEMPDEWWMDGCQKEKMKKGKKLENKTWMEWILLKFSFGLKHLKNLNFLHNFFQLKSIY